MSSDDEKKQVLNWKKMKWEIIFQMIFKPLLFIIIALSILFDVLKECPEHESSTATIRISFNTS